jgi:hypothetical protein
MTYQEYSSHMKVCEILNRKPIHHYKKIHDFLTDLWDGSHIHHYRPNEITFSKDSGWIMSITPDTLWCHHDKVVNPLYDIMSSQDMSPFLQDMLKCHLSTETEIPEMDGSYG